MKNPFLPLTQTGWFYLWLGLISATLWANQNGELRGLESLNQQLWLPFAAQNNQPTKLLRVVDVQFDQSGVQQINQLAKHFPRASFALIGRFSNQFESIYSDLNPALSSKTVFYQPQGTGLAKVSTLPLSTENNLLNFLIPQVEQLRWITSANRSYAIQPEIQSYGESLFWRNNSTVYPSFITQAVVKNLSASEINFYHTASNLVTINNERFLYGLRGEIVPNGKLLRGYHFEQLINAEQRDFSGIILIDDLSNKNADNIARSLANLIDREYLVSNWITKITEALLVILLMGLIYYFKKQSTKIKILFFIISLVAMTAMQWLMLSFQWWMPLHLIIIMAIVSLIISSLYQRELNFFIISNEEKNQWLSDSVSVFYQSKNFEKLLPLIESSQPNKHLIDTVFDIAIEAESELNPMLAKRLYLWILTNNSKHLDSIERMVELSPQELTDAANDEEATLDQTMVIDPNGDNTQQPVASILKVQKFGRYKVEGILGKGAMGIVFQGVDPKINRQVAIKTIQLNDELDGEVLQDTKERFFREAETAGNLRHANIVTIYDVGEQRQKNALQTLGYIAMDLLTGNPLSEHITAGKLLPTVIVYQLMIQMTNALDYAHEQKVIHRDIKPANIIYDDELQRGTLTDFGIACLTDHSKTKTGMIMGSPYYMSPEQVIGLKVDGRSDIFSLGVTFYQLLSGKLPFNGESIASVAFHITKTKQDSVKQWNKKLPASATRITNKALQKDVNKRYQSMKEFKQALINALKKDFNKLPLL